MHLIVLYIYIYIDIYAWSIFMAQCKRGYGWVLANLVLHKTPDIHRRFSRLEYLQRLVPLWTGHLLPSIVQATDVQGRFKSTCPAGEDFDLLTWAHVLTCTSTSVWCGGNDNLHGVHDSPQLKGFRMILASCVAAALTPVNFCWTPLHAHFSHLTYIFCQFTMSISRKLEYLSV